METLLRIPTVETGRLRLRAPRPSDFEAYAAFRASPRSVTVGGPYDRDQAFVQLAEIVGHWHLRGWGRWMIADKATDEPLGITGCFFPEGWPEPEIAWSVFDGAEGRGIAFVAATAARAHAYRNFGWTTAISLISPTNARSIRLAQRMGASPDGTFVHPKYGAMTIHRHPAPEDLP